MPRQARIILPNTPHHIVQRGHNRETVFVEDELERLTSKTYPNTIAGKTEDVTYSYDAYGNLTQGQFTEISGITYTTRYQYDDGDNITQMTLPSGRSIDYTRDEIRRLNGITTSINGTAQTIVSNMQYRGDGQVTQSTDLIKKI